MSTGRFGLALLWCRNGRGVTVELFEAHRIKLRAQFTQRDRRRGPWSSGAVRAAAVFETRRGVFPRHRPGGRRGEDDMTTKTRKPKSKPLPRYWKVAIRRITGLNFCDRSCGCGQNNGLWWWPIGGEGVPDWLPGWTNGLDTMELWRWLVESGHA